MNIKPITVEDYKDYARRHGMQINVSDAELQEILDIGNKHEQEHIKARELMREAHRERMSRLMERITYPEPPKDLDEFFKRGEG